MRPLIIFFVKVSSLNFVESGRTFDKKLTSPMIFIFVLAEHCSSSILHCSSSMQIVDDYCSSYFPILFFSIQPLSTPNLNQFHFSYSEYWPSTTICDTSIYTAGAKIVSLSRNFICNELWNQ